MIHLLFSLATAQFKESVFHVEAPFSTKSPFLNNRDILTFDGTVDEMTGGTVSVKSLNNSFADASAKFSE